MRRLFQLLSLISACLAPALLQASPDVPARASLISETQGFVPGRSFTVALRLDQDPGWHTYWQDPGDAGLATTLDFTLPQGVHAGALEWPKPMVFKAAGNLTCYGYENPALILVPITVDPAYSQDSLVLNAKATWLVCKDVCLPGKAMVSLTLKRMSANAPSANAPLFAALRPSLGQAPDGYKPQGAAPGAPLLPETPAASPHAQAVSASAAPTAAPPPAPVPAVPENRSLAWMLCLALLGGLLLNLMPCVLPVLSLKALSFVKQSHEGRAQGLALAGAFSAGVFFSFWVLAGVVLALKRGGEAVGWGFQFQQPGFILFMAGLVLVFSLNLFGIFEVWLPGNAANGLSKAGRGSGLAGAFGQGLVMTLLATPCTAPFLGTALGFAFAAPALVLVAIFTAVAAGLALPYVLLAAIPGAHAWLPKPGPWMLRFKEAMGFLLLATVLWLLWLLGGQVGVDAEAWASLWMLILATGAWIWGRSGGLEQSASRRRGVGLAVLALVLVSSFWLCPKVVNGQAAPMATEAGWRPWSQATVDSLHAQGKPVFVDFSAQWCWTCKINERGTLASDAVQEAFKAKNVALLRADWTRQDPAITAALGAHGRGGVPMYLYYPPQGAEVLLPEVITPDMVLRVLGANP
ncbi:MAG TPA: thioredoxin family protein [bacterium]|nr:thioredoxin family protein [bacterium]